MSLARRWRRRTAGVVVAVALVLAVAVAVGTRSSHEVVTTGPPTTGPPATTSSTSVSTTTSTSTSSPTSTTTKAPPPVTLREGDEGPAVLALQQRLVALGYWLGTPDGTFGGATVHAVVAFQKVEGLTRDGVVGPATADALAVSARPSPRSTEGRIVEIDLARQVLVLAVDGSTQWVFDTSTGAVAGTTPTGHFTIFRQVDGYDHSPLGVLYRPKYFHNGVAVHGYPSVPNHPASHGCVRVTNDAMDWFWSTGAIPVGTAVWVY